MKRLVVVGVLAVALAVGGCGKKYKDSDAESADDIVQADTANIDASGQIEALPTIDQGDGKSHEVATTPAEPVKEAASSTPTPVQGTGQMADYAVQKGDTLMKIAFNVYGDITQWKTIFELNKDTLQSPNVLIVGKNLKYDKPATEPVLEKNGDPYLIKRGDTLGTIADDVYANKSKWKKLYENNRGLIHDPNKIYAGFYLYYQITEEEKKEAEEHRAKRGGGGQQQLGTTDKNTESAPVPDAAAATDDPAAASPGASAGKDALKGGGLSNLAAPSNGRVPASKTTPKK